MKKKQKTKFEEGRRCLRFGNVQGEEKRLRQKKTPQRHWGETTKGLNFLASLQKTEAGSSRKRKRRPAKRKKAAKKKSFIDEI